MRFCCCLLLNDALIIFMALDILVNMSAKKKDTKSKDGEEEAVAYDAYASEKNKGKIMAIAALRFR